MPNQQPTPGPWQVYHPEPGRIRVGRSLNEESAQFVCTLFDQGNDAEKEANAKLIAAAPELLAACREIAGVATNLMPREKAALISSTRDALDRAVAAFRLVEPLPNPQSAITNPQ